MTKTYCDNCGEETEYVAKGSELVETRLHPSNIEIKFKVETSVFDSKDVCMNCYLTALHGAFKQPESKPTT